MSFLQGVTSFLESVDQRAGEMSRRQENDFPVDHYDEEHAHSQDFAEAAPPATMHATPALETAFAKADDDVKTPAESAKLIQSLLQAQSQLTSRHEKELADKHARYDALEKKFNDLQAYTREADAKVSELLVALDAAQSSSQRHEEELAAAKSRDQMSEDALQALRAELHATHEELHRSLEEKASLAAEAAATKDMRRRSEAQAEAVQSELNEYRRRVKFLLEEKDRHITNLESSQQQQQQHATTPAAPTAPTVQHSEHVATDYAVQLAAAEERARVLTEQLSTERASTEATRQELIEAAEARRVLQQQLDEADRLFEAERTSHGETRTLKRQLDDEVASLQKEISKRVVPPTGTAGGGQDLGLELRVRELAEMLMEKQAALEARRSEADQWRTRFEVSQQRLREAESLHAAVSASGPQRVTSSGRSARPLFVDEEANITMAGDVGELGRMKFMRNLSAKGAWGEHVVSAAQGLDKVSLRTGSFLRRNALLRVFLVAYVVMLHMWVFLVLTLSSVPSDPRHAVGPPV